MGAFRITTFITFPVLHFTNNDFRGCPRVAQKVIKAGYFWLSSSTIEDRQIFYFVVG
jgi:hypothetical protein